MKTTAHTKPPRSKILILTASIGNGHLSVSRAISEEIKRLSKGEFDVEIVDFIVELENFITSTAKTVYLNTLKVSPKIYEMFFAHSLDSNWPIKLLNVLSMPFLQRKFLKLMEKHHPSLLVSTYPVWDFLIKKTWEKYEKKYGKKLPFVSVITDSVSIHSVYALGKPDYYISPNEDTKVSLEHFGIDKNKIKVLGYPVSKKFITPISKLDLQQRWNLSPKRKTLLLILSAGVAWSRAKQIVAALQATKLKNIQVVIVATAHHSWPKKLSKVKWKFPIQITGWTNELYSLILGSDIVLTKAGGSTVMECIASQKPMVIIEAIPGQEMGNAMMVQKYNLGVVLNRNLSDFDHSISYILNHENLIKKNLSALQKPTAGKDIATFLLSLIQK